MNRFIPEMRLCVYLFTLSLFATIGEPLKNRESSNSYSLTVKRLSFHCCLFFSLWKLPVNRLNKRLIVFAIIKLFQAFSFSFSSCPFTVSIIVAQSKVSLPSNIHFSCFSCQIKPLTSFIITFRTLSPIQNS